MFTLQGESLMTNMKPKPTFEESLKAYKDKYPDETRRDAVKTIHDLILNKAIHSLGDQEEKK